MVKHIVFFQLADSAEGKTKLQLAQIIKRDLENLIHHIPEIIKIEVGINIPNAPKTDYDIALYSEFENMAAVDTYQENAEHLKVASFIGKVRTARAAVDYEV
jgi:hypothetical protein